ncbi:condensation domain-containing protein, partial [Klebsiella pneumoniae]|uniref:condensation domain-containing protein n=1 Tax=Klebsiella pneumoniae TaxID=573 RepID=UPI0027306F5C
DVEATPPPLVSQPRFGSPPLSYAQEGLWFLDQLQPGGSEYNIPWSVYLDGLLDAAVLERSLAELVRRHESLRTSFLLTD